MSTVRIPWAVNHPRVTVANPLAGGARKANQSLRSAAGRFVVAAAKRRGRRRNPPARGAATLARMAFTSMWPLGIHAGARKFQLDGVGGAPLGLMGFGLFIGMAPRYWRRYYGSSSQAAYMGAYLYPFAAAGLGYLVRDRLGSLETFNLMQPFPSAGSTEAQRNFISRYWNITVTGRPKGTLA